MGIFSIIKSKLFGPQDDVPPEPELDVEQFIFIKIPDPVGPVERGSKYEDKLDPLLDGVGSISGSGCFVGAPQPDGQRLIEYCAIDVDTTDRDKVRELLREALPKLGAPIGTALHYTENGQKLQDELGNGGWLLAQPRSFLHPGFGI